jgi:AAA family ATP:ADP antiporter
MVPHEWISRTARDADPRRRVLAARTLAIRGDQGTEAIHQLLADPDAQVAAAACRAAGTLRNRAYVFTLARLLANPRVRGAAIEALAQYGPAICGTLGDILDDEKLPMSVRGQVPRVLKLIPHQRSVDVLMPAIVHPEIQIRAAALKGLNRLRETSPGLRFEDAMLTQRILNEALQYFEMSAALASLAPHRGRPHTAVSLLARTLEERLRRTLERLFRLLGLCYPPNEMYWTYLAISRRNPDNRSTAVEFLDNVLSQDLKRVLLPLLEAPERLLLHGRDLFGVQVQDAESTIRSLMHSDDAWVVACAIAAAAELKLRALVPDIAQAAGHAAADTAQVARSAQSALA